MKEIRLFSKQIEALKRLQDDNTNEILYGGGARGGKSWLGNTWAMIQTYQYPESAGLIGRSKFTDLRDTTLATFFKVIRAYGVNNDFQYNAQTHIMTNIRTQSIIYFKELGWFPSDPEYDRLGSFDLTWSFIDECQQVKKKCIDVLRGRFSLLEGNGWATIPKSFYSCNPAKNWIFSDFVKPFDKGELDKDRAFIKSLVTDNPHVSEDYIKNLKKSDKVTIERLLYGNFYYDDDPARLCEYDKITDLWSNTYVEQGKKYITADLATKGSDKFVVGYWNGFRLEYIFTESKSTGKGIIDKIGELCTRFQVPASNVVYDADGLGQGLSGFTRYYEFHNGAKAKNGENYFNLKSQCYYKLADKVNEGQLYISQEDHRDEIVEELEQVKRDKIDEDGKLRLIPKKDIKERIGRSPDFTDMMAMRMYFELSSGVQAFNPDFF
jgi:phage terminase large subunit